MSEPRRIPGLGAILLIVLLAAPIAGVAWWLNHARHETVVDHGPAELDVVCLGRVDGESPVVTLDANAPGKVVKLSVAEGQTVKAGQELLRLDDEGLLLRVEEAEEALRAADVDVQIAQAELQFHPRRRALQEAAVATARARADAAGRLYREREAARPFGTVTAAEIAAAEAESRQSEHLVDAERAKLEEFDKLNPSLRVQAAEAKRAMAQTAVKQARKAVRDCILLAPGSGVIMRIQTAVGETVAPGHPAILFRPASPLVVRADLEQEFMGRVREGMPAVIKDDVRADSPTWTGTVRRVGGWVARKRSILLDPGEINDVRTVECIIAIDGKTDGLLVGQRMRVRIANSK